MTAASEMEMRIEGLGYVRLQQNIRGKTIVFELKDVAFFPRIRTNLMSLSKAQEAGITIEYPACSEDMIAKRNGKVVTVGSRVNHNVSELSGLHAAANGQLENVFFKAGERDKMKLMHKRTCHKGVNKLEEMIRVGAAKGVEELGSHVVKYDVCDEFCSGKAVAVPHKRKENEERDILELVHSELVGPLEPAGFNIENHSIAL